MRDRRQGGCLDSWRTHFTGPATRDRCACSRPLQSQMAKDIWTIHARSISVNEVTRRLPSSPVLINSYLLCSHRDPRSPREADGVVVNPSLPPRHGAAGMLITPRRVAPAATGGIWLEAELPWLCCCCVGLVRGTLQDAGTRKLEERKFATPASGRCLQYLQCLL